MNNVTKSIPSVCLRRECAFEQCYQATSIIRLIKVRFSLAAIRKPSRIHVTDKLKKLINLHDVLANFKKSQYSSSHKMSQPDAIITLTD